MPWQSSCTPALFLATPLGTALARQDAYACADVLSFLQATAAVLPIVLLAWQAPTPEPQAARRRGLAAEPAGPPRGARPWQRVWSRKLHSAGTQLNAGLRTLCGGSLRRAQRPLFLLWLLSLLWIAVTL